MITVSHVWPPKDVDCKNDHPVRTVRLGAASVQNLALYRISWRVFGNITRMLCQLHRQEFPLNQSDHRQYDSCLFWNISRVLFAAASIFCFVLLG